VQDLCPNKRKWCRFQWPRVIKRGCRAPWLLGSLFESRRGASMMDVSWECCVLLGIGLCDRRFTRPVESYRVLCIWVCSRKLTENWDTRTVEPWKNIPHVIGPVNRAKGSVSSFSFTLFSSDEKLITADHVHNYAVIFILGILCLLDFASSW
jgi:hypothetical protein